MARRVHLPVLLDRRVVLRGTVAALIASLTGCRVDGTQGSLDPAPDAGSDSDPDEMLPGDAPVTSGFARCGNELCLDLAHPSNASLAAPGGARVLTFEGRRLIVVRVSETEVIALSAVCTHSGCTVRYAPARDHIECPCHGSTFALDGGVTHGPAATPLAKFPATLDATTGVIAIEI